MLHLAIDTHLITAHFALPLLIQRPGGLLVEVTDGTADYTSMISKFKAARLVNEAGIPMQIANGRQKNVLVSICQGEQVGTTFHP